MDAARLALSVARCRMAIGVTAVALPGLAVRVIGGDPQPNGLAPLLARMMGGRDLAIGLGAVVAVDHGAPVRGWLEAGALADAVDCLATLLARKHMTTRAFAATAGLAGASSVLCLLLARRLDPPPPPHPNQPEAVVTGHTPASEAE